MALMKVFSRANLSFESGDGATLYDKDGKDYIDFTAGIGVNSLGHSNKTVKKAIFAQSEKLIHASNLYQNEAQEKLAKKICELLGREMYAFFCNSGCEANECAIKLARKYGATKFENKKYEIITLSNSFHGRTMATLQATGQDKFHPDCFAPYMDGFKFYDTIDEIIENIGDKTVAVMLELVQGEGGIKPLEVESVRKLARVLRDKGLLLITDEVQCGVYRTGEFVTSQLYGVKPCIITFAKGMAGGIPIGCCMSVGDWFGTGDHGSTFGGNHLAMSVGLAVLKKLEKLKKDGDLDKTIANFTKKLDKMVAKYPNLFIKRTGLGLMQGLVLKEASNLGKIYESAMKNGVLILKSGKDTIRFLPPLNISKAEIYEGFKRLEKALEEF